MNDAEIQKIVQTLAPWHHAFSYNNCWYGGAKRADISSQKRSDSFFSYFPGCHSILELGSLEGHDTFALSRIKTLNVTAVEGRPENIKKAEFLKDLYKIKNINFICSDIDNLNISSLGNFDAALVCGILYHLVTPWNLIYDLSKVSRNLYVWTHYWNSDSNTEIIDNLRVKKVVKDFPSPSLPALSDYSYWFTYESLMQTLKKSGFIHIDIKEQRKHYLELQNVGTLEFAASKDPFIKLNSL